MPHRRIITKLGNSYAVTLPRDVLEQADITLGHYVWLHVNGIHQIVLTRVPDPNPVSTLAPTEDVAGQ